MPCRRPVRLESSHAQRPDSSCCWPVRCRLPRGRPRRHEWTPIVCSGTSRCWRPTTCRAAGGQPWRREGPRLHRRAAEGGRRRADRVEFERPFTFSTRGASNQKGTNLVGVIRGTRSPDQYIVATAHYDHLGVRNGEVFNGADDNASGVAALLAVAGHFAATRPQHSMLIAALDAEEEGLQRRACPDARSSGAGVVHDRRTSTWTWWGGIPATSCSPWASTIIPFLKPYLAKVAQPPVVLAFGHDTPGEKEDWTRDSDHFVFREAGIPWVYFGVEDFDQHHKATDDSATIGKTFLAGVAATTIAAVHEFDVNLEEIAAQRKR